MHEALNLCLVCIIWIYFQSQSHNINKINDVYSLHFQTFNTQITKKEQTVSNHLHPDKSYWIIILVTPERMQQILGHLPLASARKLAKVGFKFQSKIFGPNFWFQISITKFKTFERPSINIGASSLQPMTFFSHFHKPSFLKILVFPFQGTIFQQANMMWSKKTILMMS